MVIIYLLQQKKKEEQQQMDQYFNNDSRLERYNLDLEMKAWMLKNIHHQVIQQTQTAEDHMVTVISQELTSLEI